MLTDVSTLFELQDLAIQIERFHLLSFTPFSLFAPVQKSAGAKLLNRRTRRKQRYLRVELWDGPEQFSSAPVLTPVFQHPAGTLSNSGSILLHSIVDF